MAGELDLATAPALAGALDSAMRHDPRVVVDLARLDFMDCSGLRVLLEAAERSRAAGVPIEVTRAGPHVRRLLELSGAMRMLRLVPPSLEAAA